MDVGDVSSDDVGSHFVFSEFAFDPLQWPRAVMDEDFAELSEHFKAEKSIVRVLGSDPDLKLAVLASWQVCK